MIWHLWIDLSDLRAVFHSCLVALLLVASLIDVRSYRIPDPLNALMLAIGLLMTFALRPNDVQYFAASGMAGFAVLWAVREAYFRLKRRHGLGLGDVKFVGASGVWIGIEGLAPMILIAALSALATVIVGAIIGRKKLHARDRLPFGPFLCLGLYAVWQWGPIAFADP